MSTYDQGILFQSEKRWADTEPAHASGTDEGVAEHAFPEQGINQVQQTASTADYYNYDDNMLATLQDVVRDVSSANMRGGFPLADEDVIHNSAHRRRMSDDQAVQRAVRNGGDIRRQAQGQYDKLAQQVKTGLGLLSIMGVNTTSLEAPSFQEFSEQVSGVAQRNLRRRLYGSDQWKAEFNGLVTKEAKVLPQDTGSIESQDKEEVGDVDQPPIIYVKLAARFAVLKGKSGEQPNEHYEMLNKLVVRNNGFPRGIVLPPNLASAFVRDPGAYKASLKLEGKDRVPENEYRQNLSQKIVTQKKILAELDDELELLEEVRRVVGGGESDVTNGAKIIENVMELFEKEIVTLGKSVNWEEKQFEQEIERLRTFLFPGPDGKSTLISRWGLVESMVWEHVIEQKRLFEWNILELGKDFISQ